MPKKKSVRKSAQWFVGITERLDAYYKAVLASDLGDQGVTWACDAAVIKLSAYFEQLMLAGLVGAINNDTSVLSDSTKVRFPKHLTDEVCEYIVTGGGYFDFKGRDGLIRLLCGYVPKDHYLVEIIKKPAYKKSIERLIALRNYAAHESRQGKAQAKEAVGINLSAAGAWAKRQNRFLQLTADLRVFAQEIRDSAPY